ncbi:DUF1489 domain-containing protein [Hyphomicrobium sp.]|uniref:DUF1489 family protein n=1 Tax=Hyphomicrobium sp. TaxID=82 RepID=UPI001D46CE79|nr:DUF1489 domain-containing protein [Hyphomicrobium sp.]MBY0559098.1 DUF1489 domain-containing protein [Hyphomicrobium sp.]
MTLHLVKLCVGASTIEDLAAWQTEHRPYKTHDGKRCVYHRTFQSPKRTSELLDGGSIYWVMKGVILVRQKLVGFEDGTKDDGTPCCLLLFAPPLIPVRPTPRRAFQGWRYLDASDAPPDLTRGKSDQIASMPADLRKKLADLCLI